MKAIIVCALLAAVAVGRKVHPPSMHPLSDELIKFINRLNTTWKAGRNFHKNTPLRFLKGLAGVHPSSRYYGLPLLYRENIPRNLPTFFDARRRWPRCHSIRVIRFQSNCGACWAFGAVETISDRICIHTKGKVQVNISAEDLMTCCFGCGDGCGGGHQPAAWEFYKTNGIVTGGLYGTADGCKPYTIPPCNYRTRNPDRMCNSTSPTPQCVQACRKGYRKSYSEDKHYAKRVYSLSSDEMQIKREIFKNGPVQAAFSVYSDFFQYQTGVYRRHSNTWIYNHSIRVLGWGDENGVPYWLAANSWSETWGGLNGFFKILRGNNECGIEEGVVAGIPKE